jgi:hypothetical protein
MHGRSELNPKSRIAAMLLQLFVNLGLVRSLGSFDLTHIFLLYRIELLEQQTAAVGFGTNRQKEEQG